MDTSVVRRRSTRLASIQSTTSAAIATSFAEHAVVVSPSSGADESDSSLSPMDEDSDDIVAPKKVKCKPKPQGKKRKGSQLKPDDAAEDGGEEATASPRKKKRAPKLEPVYVIPDVEKRTTTFKGRLGYACLNTVLRNKKPATDVVFCSRTCRQWYAYDNSLDTIKEKGIDFVKDLGVKNVEDLLTIIEWNEANNIRFMRISSDMFPFASHSLHGYPLDYCAPLLARVGELALKYNHRLTTHPGQYTQLGSPKKEVIAAAVRELKYHISQGGGVYGDKEAALERIKDTIANVLPQNVRDRLVSRMTRSVTPHPTFCPFASHCSYHSSSTIITMH
ncbi:UV-endonuclease UvdE-domain-containing protein [Salix suchowensis]|nr:UV-endonuclease UvdE-domain-containing protein [Salix suchowensis]